jgi:hypothetical protein
MATALQLNAASVIINGQGLATSANLLAEIQSFQSLESVKLINDVFTTAANTANITIGGITGRSGGIGGIGSGGAITGPATYVTLANVLLPTLYTLGNTATQGQWLIDFYPANIARVSSTGNVTCYGSYTVEYVNPDNPTAQPVKITIADDHVASMSETIQSQALLPFANGLAGFANVFQTSYGFANQAFDPISSVNLLNTKTYANAGLGYAGPTDLATGGAGSAASVVAAAIGGWGNMYDITKLSSITDPYVFGQNLLNQGLGSIGNLSAKLAATGLNTTDITRIPLSITTTTTQQTTANTQTPVGVVALPTISSTTVTTTASGVSPAVVTNIYAGITGTDLQTLITATGFTGITSTGISSLADFLTFQKVINPATIKSLAAQGITDFDTLGKYLHRVAGQGYFTSWTVLARLLQSIRVPEILGNAQITSNSRVLSDEAISTVTSEFGTGSGIFGNPIMPDYLGAAAGIPYTNSFKTLITNYAKIPTTSLISALQHLKNVVASVNITDTSTISNASYDINGIDDVALAVQAVSAALNAIPASPAFAESETVAASMLSRLATEVQSLSKAGIVFNAGYAPALKNFALNIGTTATDVSKFQTYQIFANITTPDAAGDVIRSAIAEQMNTSVFQSAGIQLTNDPGPGLAMQQAQSRNIALSTYIKQNQ